MQLPDEKKSFDKLLQDVQASAAMPDDTRDVLPDQPKVEQSDVNSVINEIERTTAQTQSNTGSGVAPAIVDDGFIRFRPASAGAHRDRVCDEHGYQAS